MSDNFGILKDRMKASDPDRLRAAMLADMQGRADLLVLYAFHLELAKVPELVSESMIGEIRYQWWRNAVDEIYAGGRVRKHEVATPLTDVLRRRGISRFHVDKLIDGRSRDLDPEPFADIAAAKAYCRQTSGVLMQIAAACLADDYDEDRISALGEAWGLTGLCRAYGYYHGSMLSGITFEDLRATTQRAYQAASGAIAPDIMPACAYAGLVPKYLAKMSGPDFDAKTQQAILSPFAKQSRQFITVLKGKV